MTRYDAAASPTEAVNGEAGAGVAGGHGHGAPAPRARVAVAATGAFAPATGHAASRLYRVMTMSLACAIPLEIIGTWSTMTAEIDLWGVPYTVTAYCLLGAAAIVQLVIGLRAPLPTVRLIWAGVAVGMLALFAALVPIAGPSGLAAGAGLGWITELAPIAGSAAVLAWRPRRAIVYAVVMFVVLIGLALFCGSEGPNNPTLGTALRQIFFVAMFMCLAAALIRTGRMLDQTVADSAVELQQRAQDDARRSSRRMMQMLIHDSIIVALLAYIGDARPDRAQGQAQQALDAIDHISTNGLPDSPSDDRRAGLPPRDVVWELQALTTGLDPQARFEHQAVGSEPVPAHVVRALRDATSEALRNSIRHAPCDRAVNREVHASVGDDAAQVVILDDGVGFDPDTVSDARMGIRHGILGRMNAIAGGKAHIGSREGYGTTIVVSWERP